MAPTCWWASPEREPRRRRSGSPSLEMTASRWPTASSWGRGAGRGTSSSRSGLRTTRTIRTRTPSWASFRFASFSSASTTASRRSAVQRGRTSGRSGRPPCWRPFRAELSRTMSLCGTARSSWCCRRVEANRKCPRWPSSSSSGGGDDDDCRGRPSPLASSA